MTTLTSEGLTSEPQTTTVSAVRPAAGLMVHLGAAGRDGWTILCTGQLHRYENTRPLADDNAVNCPDCRFDRGWNA